VGSDADRRVLGGALKRLLRRDRCLSHIAQEGTTPTQSAPSSRLSAAGALPAGCWVVGVGGQLWSVFWLSAAFVVHIQNDAERFDMKSPPLARLFAANYRWV
jgi:hypothetical protein